MLGKIESINKSNLKYLKYVMTLCIIFLLEVYNIYYTMTKKQHHVISFIYSNGNVVKNLIEKCSYKFLRNLCYMILFSKYVQCTLSQPIQYNRNN